MEKITIQWFSSPGATYSNPSPRFCWLGRPENGVWPQATNWHSCRETFCGDLKRYIRKKGGFKPHKWIYGEHKIDTNRLRIAVLFTTGVGVNDKEYVRRGLRLIHMLEKRLGWAKTSVRPAKLTRPCGRTVFVLSGSAKWLRAPQLMSLYLLAFRLGASNSFDNVKRLEDMVTMPRPKRTFSRPQINGDLKHFTETIKFWLPILDMAEDLFFFRTQFECWKVATGVQGISAFVSGGGDTVLAKRFAPIRQQIMAEKER